LINEEAKWYSKKYIKRKNNNFKKKKKYKIIRKTIESENKSIGLGTQVFRLSCHLIFFQNRF